MTIDVNPGGFGLDPNDAFAPPSAEPSIPKHEAEPRAGALSAIRRGAILGFRLASFVFVPIAAVVFLAGLAISAFGAGAGYGWTLNRILLGALIVFPGYALLFGALPGALVGLTLALLGRGPPSRRNSWWWRPNRPLPLPLGRKRTEGPMESRRAGLFQRFWPWLVGTPIVVVAACAYAGGVYVAQDVRERLGAAIAAADQDDPNWRINDLMENREEVPDDENSAIVVAEVVDLLPENWPASPAREPGRPANPISPVDQTYSRLGDLPDNARPDDASLTILRDELRTYEEAVRLARTVVNFRRGRHDLELGPTLIDTRLPQTQGARARHGCGGRRRGSRL